MVLARDPAVSVQGVYIQGARGLHLAQGVQVICQVGRAAQRIWLVLAQDPALA